MIAPYNESVGLMSFDSPFPFPFQKYIRVLLVKLNLNGIPGDNPVARKRMSYAKWTPNGSGSEDYYLL